MNTYRNILIIRLSAIGDVVMASPLIRAFRGTYPQARLTWLAEEPAAILLRHNPQLDEVIVWPRQEWQKLWRARRYLALWRSVRSFVRALRARHFDLAVDVQGLLKSAIWAWLSRAPERVGLGAREGGQWLMTRVVSRRVAHKRIGAEYLRLARELGLPTADFHMDVVPGAEAEAFATRFRAIHNLSRYVVICAFTTRPQKHWVEQRWPLLAQALEQRFGLPAVMLGGPGDVTAASRIAAAHPGILNMTGATNLLQTAALIEHATLLVGVDTGLTHMGIAFNVPTVALFGSTCPYLDTTRANARVLYHRLECSPCKRRPTCGGAFTCMGALTVEEVVSASAEVMSQ